MGGTSQKILARQLVGFNDRLPDLIDMDADRLSEEDSDMIHYAYERSLDRVLGTAFYRGRDLLDACAHRDRAEFELISFLSFGLMGAEDVPGASGEDVEGAISRLLDAAESCDRNEPGAEDSVSVEDKSLVVEAWKARVSLLADLCSIWGAALCPVELAWDLDATDDAEGRELLLQRMRDIGHAMGADEMVRTYMGGVPIEDIVA